MYRIIIILLLLLISNPVRADIINTFGRAFPQEARLPFYIALFILAVYTFISIKKDIKKQEQTEQTEQAKKENKK